MGRIHENLLGRRVEIIEMGDRRKYGWLIGRRGEIVALYATTSGSLKTWVMLDTDGRLTFCEPNHLKVIDEDRPDLPADYSEPFKSEPFNPIEKEGITNAATST